MAGITKAELIAFEADIAECFNRGEIRAPIHLSGGNEDQLIEIFKNVKPTDWVCSNWRSHYHALLHGIPPDRLKADILAGKSITLCYPEYKFITSAIVGGIVPIALGLAWAEKHQNLDERVWVFCGDMTFQSGIVDEVMHYAGNFGLPLLLVVEDNELSVCTGTADAWGLSLMHIQFKTDMNNNVHSYRYQLLWPHSGAGKRVEF